MLKAMYIGHLENSNIGRNYDRTFYDPTRVSVLNTNRQGLIEAVDMADIAVPTTISALQAGPCAHASCPGQHHGGNAKACPLVRPSSPAGHVERSHLLRIWVFSTRVASMSRGSLSKAAEVSAELTTIATLAGTSILSSKRKTIRPVGRLS